MKKIDEDHQEQLIIKKFQKRQSLYIVITVISVTLIPLLLVALAFAQSNDLGVTKLLKILFILNIIAIPVILFLRRCPKCGINIGKYNIFPSKCPNCGAKLK